MYEVPEFNPETNTYYYLDEKKFENLGGRKEKLVLI